MKPNHHCLPLPRGGEGRGERKKLFLLSLLFSACFNPDDILPVRGTLVSSSPVEGQVVRLLRDPQTAMSTDCSGAKPFKETTASADGTFSFDVFRAQAIKLSGFGTFCFRVETTFASGSTVFSDIVALGGEVTLPPFTDWRAQPTRVDGVLRFEPVAPLPEFESFEGDQLVHRAEWRTADGGLAWAADDRVMGFDLDGGNVLPERQPMPFDDEVLEDFSGVVTLFARLTVEGRDDGPFSTSPTTIELRSGDTLALSGSRPSLSRGLPCIELGAPCPLTDGSLGSIDGGAFSQPIIFELPAPTTFSTVVVRGVETQAQLMGMQLVTADGGTLPIVQKILPTSLWNAGVPGFVVRPLADGGLEFGPRSDPRFFTVKFDAGVPVREVRMGFAGDTVGQLNELSLFE